MVKVMSKGCESAGLMRLTARLCLNGYIRSKQMT